MLVVVGSALADLAGAPAVVVDVFMIFSICSLNFLVASLVPQRVETVSLYGIAFCFEVPGAERSLHNLQTSWAKRILGVNGFQEGVGHFLTQEVGWHRTLVARMFIEAMMLEARVLLMPPSTAANRLLLQARDPNCHLVSWATRVRQLRASLYHFARRHLLALNL